MRSVRDRSEVESEQRVGIGFGIAAYVIWGLSPLFWNLVDDVGVLDLLLHRTVWAIPLLAVAITVMRRWGDVRRGYSTWAPRLITMAAAVLLFTNWAVFLWAVTSGHVVEASLGYFINPLVSVALGVVVLGERLRRLQWLAVAIAAVGVSAMAVRVGVLPWVSLTLAFSFGIYGLLKKRPETPAPVVSLFGEIGFLAIPSTIALIVVANGQSFGTSPSATGFLIATGVMTVAPLLLFGAAAKRIPLSMVGVLQYIAPTLQLIVGVMVYGEILDGDRLIGFGFVWIALALYTYDGLRSRPTRRPVG